MLDTAGGSTSAPAGDAAIPVSPAPHIVHLACPCPGHPHPFDVVTLHKSAPLTMGAAIASVLRYAGGDPPRVEAGLALEFLRWGIASWTFRDLVDDENGDPQPRGVPITEPIERPVLERWLPFASGGLEVIEAASELYEGVLAPFVKRISTRSPGTPTGALISAPNGSGPTHRKPSKRSSRSTLLAGTSSEAPAP
jgi:hypothetical protein